MGVTELVTPPASLSSSEWKYSGLHSNSEFRLMCTTVFSAQMELNERP